MIEFSHKRRVRNLYDPTSTEPYELSRSKLELLIQCPRCFYLDRRLGVGRPSIPGYTLNLAVDTLLKREFDSYRRQGAPHPLMSEYKIEAIPYAHEEIDTWRNNRRGVRYLHPETNLLIYGAPDDIWVDSEKRLIVVDYKATSAAGPITLDSPYKTAYKRQVEVYQWLLRENGFPVSDTAYFVYANGRKDRDSFSGHLEFNLQILSHNGDSSWVAGAVRGASLTLKSPRAPEPTKHCSYCAYLHHASESGSEE